MAQFRAPGRVNLIGEHTDYNLGLVLPIALDLACFVTSTPSDDGQLRLRSEEMPGELSFSVEAIGQLSPRHDWSDYVIGVARELLRLGRRTEPQSLQVHSTVPVGAGLSSSAALEVSAALALSRNQPLEPLALAELCQRAEVEFVGLPCGIMDQYISVFGREHAALQIDCRSLQYELVELPDGIEIIAVNSMVKHSLGDSAYSERTQQCIAAAAALGLSSLRDASFEDLERIAASIDSTILRRARHVIGENERVRQFAAASRARDLITMGRLLVESHRSLQHDYEVSCAELDFLVNTALAIDGVLGARMTGGGFGGCTVNLMLKGVSEGFVAAISGAYREKFAITPETYACRPSAGATEIDGRGPT